jgi:PTS system mannose-specific IIB component
MAVPSHMTLNIYNAETAIQKLNNIEKDGKDDQIIILVKSPIPVLKMLENGLNFEKLTVGGMGVNENRSRLYRNLAASDKERKGLPIQIQVLPSDAPMELMPYL